MNEGLSTAHQPWRGTTIGSISGGSDLIGPAKQLLALAAEQGATILEFRAIIINESLAQRFGVSIGDSVVVTAEASRSGLIDLIRRLQ